MNFLIVCNNLEIINKALNIGIKIINDDAWLFNITSMVPDKYHIKW